MTWVVRQRRQAAPLEHAGDGRLDPRVDVGDDQLHPQQAQATRPRRGSVQKPPVDRRRNRLRENRSENEAPANRLRRRSATVTAGQAV